MGREFERIDACICMAQFLCCAPEAITTLLIDYLKKKFTVTITVLSWKKKILGILNATKRYQIRSDQSLSRVRLFATP